MSQFHFSLKKSLDKFQKSLENITKSTEKQLSQAVKEVAYATHAGIVAGAQKELNSTRQDYLKGLKITEVGENSYLIHLDGTWANKIEDGWGPYDMVPGMLASNKTVSTGRRAGLPWVQQSQPKGKNKESHKFAYVPLEKKPFSKVPKHADMASAVRAMAGFNKVTGQMQKITKIFTDEAGNALEGKVAIGKSDNPLIDNTVKYQKKYVSSTGKETIQSTYITYRAISQIGKAWVHPGFKGARLFQEAEKEIAQHMDRIVQALL